MKKLLVILVMLVAVNASGQWFWQNPLPQGNDLNDIFFSNSQIGWLVGRYGTIMKTTNAGMSYTISQLNNDHNYINVKFFNNIGYVGGNSKENLNSFGHVILKTTNNGSNWATISNSAVDVYRKLYFSNQTTGWLLKSAASGMSSKMFKTTDAGNTWDSTIFNAMNLVNFYFLNDLTGWIGGSNRMLKTTNGGNNWISYTNNFEINTLYFADINVGFAGNTFGGIYKTTDSGQNWTLLNGIQYFPTNIRDIYFQNANTGIAVGLYRNIMRTTNSGLNWELLEFDTNAVSGNMFNRIINVNGTGYVVGNFGEIRKSSSINYGASWDRVTKFTKTNFYQIRFLNNTTGFITSGGVIKYENVVLKTTNAGDNWIKAFDNPDTNCTSSYFVNESTGWIAGKHLYRTNNGGVNWQIQLIQNNPTNKYINPYFLNTLTGFITDQFNTSGNISNAVLLKTTNGGVNWNSTSLSGRAFFKLKFVNDNEAWITVNGGTPYVNSNNIYKTNNGGANWTLITRPNDSVIDIDLLNSNTGWSCQSSSVSFTTNSGQNWITKLSGTNFKFVRFFNLNTGYVISSTNIYKTVNGGNTWNTKSFQPINISQNDAYFINENTGWILGNNGAIIKTTNSGNVFVSYISTEIPSAYSLSQNYPNPFNSTSNLKFEIANTGDVKLIVYDIMGKEVQTLVNEKLQPGTYEASFDGSALNSGVYFYKLVTDGFTETKKMILIK